MKRVRRKEVFWLMLPPVMLLVLAVALPGLQAKPKPTLTLTSITVTPAAKSHVNDPDVKVEARFDYSESFQERYLRPQWSMTLTNTYIIDGNGKKHTMMTWNSFNSRQTIAATAFSRDFAIFPLWLRYFPKSAGKLTFHFTAIAHDGFQLPVSVVVRK